MLKRHIYLYQEDISDELPLVFEAINDNIRVDSVTADVMTIVDTDYYNEEPFDIEELHMLLLEDFNRDITIVVEPYLDCPFPLGDSLRAFVPAMPPGVHYFEDVIAHAVLKHNETLKQEIKTFIASRVKPDVIHTAREFIANNMNSSISAKKLFMHRNTLNYRIDNFIEQTTINIKTFRGANAIYMLYNF